MSEQKTVFGDAIETFRSARSRTVSVGVILSFAETKVREMLLEEAGIESRIATLRKGATLAVQLSNSDVTAAKADLVSHRRDELAATIAVQTVAAAHADFLRDALLPPESAEPPIEHNGQAQAEDSDETAPL